MPGFTFANTVFIDLNFTKTDTDACRLQFRQMLFQSNITRKSFIYAT